MHNAPEDPHWEFAYLVPGAEGEQLGDYRAPSTVVARWVSEKGDPVISVRFLIQDEAVRISSVRFDAAETGREVRMADLAALDLNNLAERAIAASMTEVSAPNEHGAVRITMRGTPDPARRAAVRQARKPSQRRAVTTQRLQEVAEVYRQALAAGEAPTAAVATHLGRSHRTASDYIGHARARSYLGPALGQGRAGEGENDGQAT